jgi:hypothetical protein
MRKAGVFTMALPWSKKTNHQTNKLQGTVSYTFVRYVTTQNYKAMCGIKLYAVKNGNLAYGMHPHLQWNRVILLAMFCYIGDPDIIPDHQL